MTGLVTLESKLTGLICSLVVSWINQYANKEGIKLKKMTIGVEIFLINVIKMVVMYSLSLLFGILPLTLVTHISFVAIKRFSYGLHALNSTLCTLIKWLSQKNKVFVKLFSKSLQGLGQSPKVLLVS